MRAFLAASSATGPAVLGLLCPVHRGRGARARAPALPRPAPSPSSAKPFQPPFGDYLLGTDMLGRDLAAGLIHGARTSLLIGVVATADRGAGRRTLGGAGRLLGGRIDDAADAASPRSSRRSRSSCSPSCWWRSSRRRSSTSSSPSPSYLAADRAAGARRVPRHARRASSCRPASSLGMSDGAHHPPPHPAEHACRRSSSPAR